jgi:hypothetical protein
MKMLHGQQGLGIPENVVLGQQQIGETLPFVGQRDADFGIASLTQNIGLIPVLQLP